MRRNMIETVLGGVVLIVAAVFVAFAYSNASINTANGYTVTAKFDRVGELKEGDDVKLAGIKVGSVAGQHLDPETYEAVVTLTIERELRLPSDTVAEIAPQGLMGGSFVQLLPGASDEAIKDGGRITRTQGAVGLMELIGKAMFSSKGGLDGGQMAPADPLLSPPQ